MIKAFRKSFSHKIAIQKSLNLCCNLESTSLIALEWLSDQVKSDDSYEPELKKLGLPEDCMSNEAWAQRKVLWVKLLKNQLSSHNQSISALNTFKYTFVSPLYWALLLVLDLLLPKKRCTLGQIENLKVKSCLSRKLVGV